MTDDRENFVIKTNNCVDEYADSFGYSSAGEGSERMGSIAFFKHVTLWPVDGGNKVTNSKQNMATIRMSEDLMLKLAEFITDQYEQSKRGQLPDA